MRSTLVYFLPGPSCGGDWPGVLLIRLRRTRGISKRCGFIRVILQEEARPEKQQHGAKADASTGEGGVTILFPFERLGRMMTQPLNIKSKADCRWHLVSL